MNIIEKSSRGIVKFPFRGHNHQIIRQTAQLVATQATQPQTISIQKIKQQIENGWQQLFGKVPKLNVESKVKSYDEMVGPKGLPFFGSALDYTFMGPYSPKEYTTALKDRHQK